MTKDEALKLALEALETPWNAPYVDGCDLALGKRVKAITAIKEVLAQPEQEPVATVESLATVVGESGNQEVTMSWWHEPALPVGTKLYTTPPQRTWVGLTNDELTDLFYNTNLGQQSAVAQAIALLKERNT